MTSLLKKIGKWVFWIVGLLAGLVLLVVIAFSLIYSPEYISRVLRWGDADVYDYQKFPERRMAASAQPFFFKGGRDEDLVRAYFESHALVDDLETLMEDTHTQALFVIQDDMILYEGYTSGADRDSIVTSFSMAKSYTSALIGIAIAEGHIGSAHDPITDYLPELSEREPAFEEITIQDLLRMSSGIKYREFPFINGDDAKTYYYPDLRQLALEDTFVIDPPGEYFLYNNYHPLLLGMILERATGVPVAEYLEQKIWGAIGTEYPGSWSLDERGFEKMESGINARAIDFAKFGRLYLNNGNWEGVQVVPEDWISESIQENPDFQTPSYRGEDFGHKIYQTAKGGYYGYMWYGLHRDNGQDDFFAEGNHGQIIYVSPQSNLIIVRNGEQYGPGFDVMTWIEIFYHIAGEMMLEL
jgi:CubicO group peptidase (beta-lactamase class C family)